MKRILLAFSSAILMTSCASQVTPPPHSIGSDTAPVVIEEFSDLQCPACSAISPQVEAIVRKNSDIVRMQYHHFPLSYHKYAFHAAEASECAADQGKFWEYINLAFANQKNLADDGLLSIANKLKLEMPTFKACLNSGSKRKKVFADMAEGRRRGVPATPSFYVNKKLVRFSGSKSFESYLRGLAE